jgi:cell division septation protein DedD
MAPSSRGTYEPPGDDIHIFDGAEDDDDAEGSRLPLLIVIALFVLAAFGGVVWLAYTQGVARGRSDAPRTIVAQSGPAKVAADQNGQAAPYKGLKIYQQPAPADEEADHKVTPPPVNTAPSEVAAPETTVITPHAEGTQPKPAESVAKPAETVARTNPPPVLRNEPKPEATAPPRQLSETPPPPPAMKTAVTAPASGGAYVLQIGAYKSQAEADAAWKSYQARHAGLLSGYGGDVKKVDLGEKGTWYRLRTGSFASKEAAASLCSKLTAEGGACFPAK